MNFEQPKPDSKKYSDLINEIQKGIIKIPKFQREFVWSIDKTAKLLDSILKGYPIGTFILWQTDERINDIKNVGNLEIPETPEGTKVQYVLDGQQRITSLFAAYLGAQIQKTGEKKVTDYSNIVVNLDKNLGESDDQFITAEDTYTLLSLSSSLPRVSLKHVLGATRRAATRWSAAASCCASSSSPSSSTRSGSRRP